MSLQPHLTRYTFYAPGRLYKSRRSGEWPATNAHPTRSTVAPAARANHSNAPIGAGQPSTVSDTSTLPSAGSPTRSKRQAQRSGRIQSSHSARDHATLAARARCSTGDIRRQAANSSSASGRDRAGAHWRTNHSGSAARHTSTEGHVSARAPRQERTSRIRPPTARQFASQRNVTTTLRADVVIGRYPA